MNNIVARDFPSPLERSVLETLAYFDVFDFPVCQPDLHRYLHCMPVTTADLPDALHSLLASGRIEFQGGYYVLAGRRPLIDLYEAGADQHVRRLHLAIYYGRLLALLPFIRMVAVTGSVAMQNGGVGADYDYLLVTQAGRLWLGRAFAVLLGRWASLQGHTLCPNIILSEGSLIWPRQDLYTAHELMQMIPVSGFRMYQRLRALNGWAGAYLPNAEGSPSPDTSDPRSGGPSQRLVEAILRTRIGAVLERLEMQRKIARFRRQPGFGIETDFSADVCRGNFQNHGGQTRQAFEHRLAALGLVPATSLASSDSLMDPPAVAPRRSAFTPPNTSARPTRSAGQNRAVTNG